MKFNIKLIRDHSDQIVGGSCMEVNVFVCGETISEIRDKMKVAIKGYFKAFPEEKEKYNKLITVDYSFKS